MRPAKLLLLLLVPTVFAGTLTAQTTIFSDDMEHIVRDLSLPEPQRWSSVDLSTMHYNARRAHSGQGAWTSSRPGTTALIDGNDPNFPEWIGMLHSPWIDLTNAQKPVLKFWQWVQAPNGFVKLTAAREVFPDIFEFVTLWETAPLTYVAAPQWTEVTVDLAEVAGQRTRFLFEFRVKVCCSFPQAVYTPRGEGWYLDDVRVIDTAASPVVAVTLTPTSAAVQRDQTKQFTATARRANATTTDVTSAATWATSNASMATVTAGLVMGRTPGTVTITATYEGSSASAQVTVTEPPPDQPPIIRGSASPPPSPEGWHNTPVTINFQCVDAENGITSCTAPINAVTEGADQTVTGTATDSTGKSATTTSTVSIDLTLPSLVLATTPEVTSAASLHLSGTAVDALSGLKTVLCDGRPATMNGSAFTCAIVLLEGTNTIRVAATDRANNRQERSLTVLHDTTLPGLTILSPEWEARVNLGSMIVETEASDNDRVAAVTINGTAAILSGGRYRATVLLTEGVNAITAVATDRAGNSTSATRNATFFSIPTVAIASPADLSVLGGSTITVSGPTSGAVSVVVNGTSATITNGVFSAANIPLVQGRTVISARATSAAGHVATANIHVYRDSLPPRVSVYAPVEGQIVSQSPITVTGMVDDVAVGTINSGQATVTVNGLPAEVANRAFMARNVPLNPGSNSLTIAATDQGGNRVSVSRRVTLDPGAGLARIIATSGNDQSGAIGSQLAGALVVRLTDASGAAAAGKLVTYRVVRNDGIVTDGSKQGRSVDVTTDASGTASVRWTLGLRSGAGNQRVEAVSSGFPGKAEFTATGRTGAPERIVVDAGNGQFGVTGAPLQRPLIAVVVDKGSNRIANVPVRFKVAQGAGSIDGQSSRLVQTDSDGRAWVVPTLGPQPGIDNNILTASVEGHQTYATFYATGRPAGRVEDTRISGVVVDNTNIPVAGVSVRIEGAAGLAQTDGQGRFAIHPAPVGYVKLIVDGSTALRPGTWPTLEFAMYTNPGQDNTLGMPIYILPIDVARGIQVSEQAGGTLTLPELPGFSLTIAPGSATFPSGSRSGTVSVTLVHSDKMPMAPGFGQQPRFIVTIQPTGVHFDPPAAITFPNVDGLRPGEVTEMYSFDHDLGQFVSIGTGSITEDGTTLRSDPGVGIIKGGWHCGGNPTPTGTPANCGDCAQCNGTLCEEDPLRVGRQCNSDGQPCTDDVCVAGRCTHPALQSQVSIEAKYVDRDDPTRTWSNATPLVLGQHLYGNTSAGDHVRWKVTVTSTKPVTAYKWTATGPQTYLGPAGPEWQVDNITWKPGFYLVEVEVTFQGGCKIVRKWGQYVGIRTENYILYGVVEDFANPTSGVSARTRDLLGCPEANFNALIGSRGDFDDPSSSYYIPDTESDRLWATKELLRLTRDIPPYAPTDLETPLSASGPGFSVFGLDSITGFRQAAHVQFKYRVRNDGTIVWPPEPVGNVFAKTGSTPAPCWQTATSIFAPPGTEHARNGALESYGGGTQFGYVMLIQGGADIEAGNRHALRRELTWVLFRFRFDGVDGHIKSDFSTSSDSWTGADDRDFSAMPSFYLYRRYYNGGQYHAALMPSFPLNGDLMKFLRIAPRWPGARPGTLSYPP